MLLRRMSVTRGSVVGEEYRALRLVSIINVKSVSREGLYYIFSIEKVQMKVRAPVRREVRPRNFGDDEFVALRDLEYRYEH
jgi:hypothetical protein